jgi:hypothetical protein
VKHSLSSAVPTSSIGIVYCGWYKESHLDHEHGELQTTSLRQLLVIGSRPSVSNDKLLWPCRVPMQRAIQSCHHSQLK